MSFQANRRLEKELKEAPEMEAMLRERAERVAHMVREIAPRGDSPRGQHYVDMIEVETVTEKGEPVVKVVARKFTSVFLEFGTSKTPTFAPLRRGTMAAGLRLKADG